MVGGEHQAVAVGLEELPGLGDPVGLDEGRPAGSPWAAVNV